MTHNATIPKTIKQHRYGKLLGVIWNEVNSNDGIVTIVFCGKRGKGKSLSMAEWARLLDRGEDDVGRFEPEHIRLDPVEFFQDLTGDYPRGKVICMDDAGLHMYKSDALSDLLKRVSKVLQNIRYKHPIILMSLPYFGQLMKDARDMTDIYIEMRRINKKKKVAIGAVQTLKISPFTGDLFRYNILQAKQITQPKFVMNIRHWLPVPYAFNKPPDDFIKAYEAVKKPTLDKLNEEHLRAIREQRAEAIAAPRQKKMSLRESIEYCMERIEEVKDRTGKVTKGKIMQLTDENNNQLFGSGYATMITKELKNT